MVSSYSAPETDRRPRAPRRSGTLNALAAPRLCCTPALELLRRGTAVPTCTKVRRNLLYWVRSYLSAWYVHDVYRLMGIPTFDRDRRPRNHLYLASRFPLARYEVPYLPFRTGILCRRGDLHGTNFARRSAGPGRAADMADMADKDGVEGTHHDAYTIMS